ncbi:MAG: hypothetical protein RMI56_04085 [Sulfolobales archaeon]|nr:hypothetical protein [Sulfolobales archaeon]MDW8082963.1 hypothetical protein [Sulfolobales archaeon]
MEIRIVCRGDYKCRTLASWIREVLDILSSEFSEDVEIREEHSDELIEPEVYVESELVLVGLPGEEGYLIEVLKHAVESLRKTR